jgi:hypothetical protein
VAERDRSTHFCVVVEFAPSAIVVLCQVPGTLARVKRELLAILETASEIASAFHWSSHISPDEFLHLRIAGYQVAYTLDLNGGVARVVSVTPLTERDELSSAA